MQRKILIVEDDIEMCKMLSEFLIDNEYYTEYFHNADSVLSELKRKHFDVIVADLNLPGMNGVELCERIVENRPDIPVIVMTAFGSINNAVNAIHAGAYDFIVKPFDLDIFLISVKRALKHRIQNEKIKSLSQYIEKADSFGELIGKSQPMQELFTLLSHLVNAETTVLITGESGTGKELIAKALHKRSNRREEPFIAINCTALPETLIESELFGYTKGSFTDAKEDKNGLFIQADGGTMFLDEIGEIPISFQPKLLRALEEHSVRPIGGGLEVRFDVRIISATNTDLEKKVKEGLFREDLYYRLNVIQVKVPPLRIRDMDVILLAEHFIKKFADQFSKSVKGLSTNVIKKLLDYDWPGNVRELRNAVERAVALTQYEEISVDDLPEKIQSYKSYNIIFNDNPSNLLTIEELEYRYILHVLNVVNDNQKLAAKILGIDRKTLYRKLQKYDKKSEAL